MDDARKGGAPFRQMVTTAEAKRGDFPAALQSAKEAIPGREFALKAVAKEQARLGRTDEVLAWVRTLNNSVERGLALAGLSEGIEAGLTHESGAKPR